MGRSFFLWRRAWLIGLGLPVLAVASLAGFFLLVFSWNWFIPFAERNVSAIVGRPVTIAGVHVRPGRISLVTLSGLQIGNPPGFAADAPFARIEGLLLGLDTPATLRGRILHITNLAIEGVHAGDDAGGRAE